MNADEVRRSGPHVTAVKRGEPLLVTNDYLDLCEVMQAWWLYGDLPTKTSGSATCPLLANTEAVTA